MININPIFLTDFYKTIHHNCYAPNMTRLTSYWTARMSRIPNIDKVVMFGLQGFIKNYLIDYFNDNFFNECKAKIVSDYKIFIRETMGEDYTDTKHIEALHDLGYLPIQIRAIVEGTRVPIKVPMLEITNTHDDFAWLVNYLETFMSCNLWQPITSATIAHTYREIISSYYDETVDEDSRKVNTACGDFSMRGGSSFESTQISGGAFLTSFRATATMGAIQWLETFYGDEKDDGSYIGYGTPSTEHSVMSSYGTDELSAYKRLITEVYPKGPLSIVSDTYDYWNVITNILVELKEDIMNRDGKIIIRGDSGDPVKIICGEKIITLTSEEELYDDNNFELAYVGGSIVEIIGDDGSKRYFEPIVTDHGKSEKPYDRTWIERENCPYIKGTVELLWDIFGGTINSKGYKVLDPHIGTIYGDSITPERADQICSTLKEKGFSAENCTFGTGAYSMFYVTRDTFGFALKATHAVFNGTEERPIYKDPKTDTGNFKKSQRGLCVVAELHESLSPSSYNPKEPKMLTYKDGLTIDEQARYDDINLLVPVFKDGILLTEYSLEEIRNRLHGGEF